MNNSEALTNEGWLKLYNPLMLDNVVKSVETGNVSIWSKELLDICKEGSVLEVGCGTGITSLCLAKHGVNVTALDYTESSVSLVKEAAKRLQLDNINVVLCDATILKKNSSIFYFKQVFWSILIKGSKLDF